MLTFRTTGIRNQYNTHRNFTTIIQFKQYTYEFWNNLILMKWNRYTLINFTWNLRNCDIIWTIKLHSQSKFVFSTLCCTFCIDFILYIFHFTKILVTWSTSNLTSKYHQTQTVDFRKKSQHFVNVDIWCQFNHHLYDVYMTNDKSYVLNSFHSLFQDYIFTLSYLII